MRLRSMCVVLCTAALVVSCSSDSKGSDLGLGTTATTQAPTSTTGAPQTTAAQTTVASTTTTTTTTEPPTTATTTPVPTDAPTTQAPPVTEAPTTTVELSAEDKVKARLSGGAPGTGGVCVCAGSVRLQRHCDSGFANGSRNSLPYEDSTRQQPSSRRGKR